MDNDRYSFRICLMYHDIYQRTPHESGFQDKKAFPYKIQADIFEDQVKAVARYCHERPEVEVEFTFDDGGVSFLTLVAPILEKYGLRGTFFISTAYLNTPQFLTTGQLAELAQRGHRIGSHSHTHPMLTELTEEEIAKEWTNSVNILHPFLTDEMTASIPNGDGNTVVMQKATEAGIQRLYTSIPTTEVKRFMDMQVLGRYVVLQGMSTEDVMKIICDNSFRRRLYIRWQVLRCVKDCLGSQYERIKRLYFRFKCESK